MSHSPVPQGTRYGVPARRKEIEARLSDAYSQDMLDQREFESRLERAEAATTIEELDALTADFGQALAAAPSTAAPLKSLSVLSSHTHILVPGGPETVRAFTLLGECKVDLRAYRGSGLTLTVRLSGGLSEAKILVPQGTRVERRCRVILGEFNHKLAKQPGEVRRFWDKLFGSTERAPDSPYPPDGPPPTLILEGTWLLGDTLVEEALP